MNARSGGNRNSQRGVTLIIVLGVLLALCLIGTVFATLSGVERSLTRNFMDGMRARRVAQSGIEAGFERIQQAFQLGLTGPHWKPLLYFGVDLLENGGTPAVPLRKAKNPSCAHEDEPLQNPLDANVRPQLVDVDGVPLGFSGYQETSTYGAHSDQFALRISDCSAQIYLNDGVVEGPTSAVSQNLKRILNALGAHPNVRVPTLGELVVAARPRQGFATKTDILPALGNDRSKFERVAPFVTAHAWVDPNVANPVPLSPETAALYPVSYYRGSPPVYRYGRGYTANWLPNAAPLLWYTPGGGPRHNAVYAVDELHPQWIETTSRAPVNINAASEEVLVALLTDLQGFFALDQRRSEPSGSDPIQRTKPGYDWLDTRYSYDATGSEGDELAFLYPTVPIVGPGGTTPGGISAVTIAREILASRNRQGDYSDKPFAGPFETWSQFNLFCDYLVVKGVLIDTRPIFTDWTGSPTMAPSASTSQQRIASQAIADVLKANFNPNLHLNELNPDANLAALVDKTDLIVNSTEFCFTPTGYFEIESLGRVLRPLSGPDALTSTRNDLVSQASICSAVQLFTLHRETHQKQFSAGTLSDAATPIETNNNRTIELGPEVNQGPLPRENEWDGYLALPTVGGLWPAGSNQRKTDGTLMTTPLGGAKYGSSMHSHFAFDFKAHHHASAVRYGDKYRDECGSTVLEGNYASPYMLSYNEAYVKVAGKRELTANFNDPTETLLSPYDPTRSPAQHRYRLARSFRMPDLRSTAAKPALSRYAQSDLRIDGAYSERHSAIAYWIDEEVSFNSLKGAVSFWVKPNFRPEQSSKTRQFLSLAAWHRYSYSYINPRPWGIFAFPAHDTAAPMPSLTEMALPGYNFRFNGVYQPGWDPADNLPKTIYGGAIADGGANAAGRYPPASLGCGTGSQCYSGHPMEWGNGYWGDREGGCLTPSLNHRFHPNSCGKKSDFDANRWMHVTMAWDSPIEGYSFGPPLYDQSNVWKIYVNGRLVPGTRTYWHPQMAAKSYSYTSGNQTVTSSYYGYNARLPMTVQAFKVDGSSITSGNNQVRANTLRLGEASTHGFTPYPRNFSADATFDELYLWMDNRNLTDALNIYRMGRYAIPRNGVRDALFESADLALNPSGGVRQVPAPASSGTMPSPATSAPAVTLLGISWTWHPETFKASETDPRTWDPKNPLLYDYQNPAAPVALKPRVRMWVMADGTAVPATLENPGYAPLLNGMGQPLTVQNPDKTRYRLQFQVEGASFDTVLLATPVVDDITLYYSVDGPSFVSYFSEAGDL